MKAKTACVCAGCNNFVVLTTFHLHGALRLSLICVRRFLQGLFGWVGAVVFLERIFFVHP